jgi:hypothetical protein
MNEYLQKHYSKLLGYTMVGLVMDDSSDTWAVYGKPLIGLKFKKGKDIIMVFPMSDPEGNDEGFLEIIETENK